jgi:SulP family sulfate permease
VAGEVSIPGSGEGLRRTTGPFGCWPGRRPAWAASLSRDVIAGVSVAFVLVPQSLAYAQLAGLPPEHGLYAAAFAPIAAAIAASSPYLQTGPTAITSLLVLGAVSAHAPAGTAEFVQLAAVLAVLVGAWRLLLGLVRGGPLAYLLSQPVLLGFTAATGLLIISSQLPAVLGTSAEGGNPLRGALAVIAEPATWHWGAMLFALATVAVMLLGRRLSPLFPAVLLTTTVAILVSAAADFAGPTVGEVPAGLPEFTLFLPWDKVPALLVPSLIIALVGFAEPSAIARRYAAADRHNWDPNREMISQGLANLAAGLGGGYAVGGSFSRTALNRLAGARTRLSGAVSGAAALAFLPLAGLFESLPTAVLGAIVIVAVAPLVHPRSMWSLWTFTRPQAVVGLVTFVLTLALAPRVERAVLLGIGLAIAVHLWRELHITVPHWTEGDSLHLRPRGVLYFASAPALEETFTRLLAEHVDARALVVHCEGLGRVDLTGALVLKAVLDDALAAGIATELRDVPPQAQAVIARVLQPPPRPGRLRRGGLDRARGDRYP